MFSYKAIILISKCYLFAFDGAEVLFCGLEYIIFWVI
jgi:hypothetical protein